MASDNRSVTVRPMRPDDLKAADQIRRLAFGTFLNVPQPAEMFGDVDHVYSRFRAAPAWAFVAERAGEVVGSNFAVRWGSYGFSLARCRYTPRSGTRASAAAW
jgi:predicted N-acetyltransferase YhbS